MVRAIAALLALAVASPPAVTSLFQCRIDGQVRNHCCCQTRHAARAGAAGTDLLFASPCCARTDLARTLEPAVPGVEQGPVLAPVPLVLVVAWAPDVRLSPAAYRRGPAATGPPRSGPSLYLQARALLI